MRNGHTIVMVTHDPEMAALAQTEDCVEPWEGFLPSGGWAGGYFAAVIAYPSPPPDIAQSLRIMWG